MAVAPTGLLLVDPPVYVMPPLEMVGRSSEHKVGATARGGDNILNMIRIVVWFHESNVRCATCAS